MPDHCFAPLYAAGGRNTAKQSAKLLVRRVASTDERSRFTGLANEFLNFLNPGSAALLTSANRLPAIFYEIESVPQYGQVVNFTPDFFERGTLERLFVLSAFTWGRARLLAPPTSADETEMDDLALAFARWASGEDTPPGVELLGGLVREPGEEAPSTEGADILASALVTNFVPDVAAEVAEWLTEASMPVGV